MLSHGVIFNLVSARVCLSAIIETYLSYEKDIWIAVTDYYMYNVLLINCAISIGSCTFINKFYSFTIDRHFLS